MQTDSRRWMHHDLESAVNFVTFQLFTPERPFPRKRTCFEEQKNIRGPHSHSHIHEAQSVLDLRGHLPVLRPLGSVAHKVHVPRVQFVDVGVTTRREGSQEVDGLEQICMGDRTGNGEYCPIKGFL